MHGFEEYVRQGTGYALTDLQDRPLTAETGMRLTTDSTLQL